MKFSKKVLSQTLTQLCLVKGIDHIVISPGSRNAPLIIGFTEDPNFKNFSVVDERCAAFFALGMAKQLGRPVAMVCTSGSALLNYYPAVAEAFYSDVPLVVISADRPAHLIDVGDGQTIRQENVFANHILYSANCKEGVEHQHYNETEVNKALNISIEQRGPVHINVPFTEPLYETVSEPTIISKNTVPLLSSEVFTEDLQPFLVDWNRARRKMILVGVLPPQGVEQEFVEALARDESVIVLTETTSNLHHELFFPAIDQLIAPLTDSQFKLLQPEVLLTFGGLVVSKKVKAFLRKYTPEKHYHVDPKKAMDTFFTLSHHFKTDVNTFLESLSSDIKEVKSDYRNYWLKIKKHRLQQHSAYEKQIVFSDFKVFSEVFKELPSHLQLQLANSATVRYAQLFDLDKSLEVFCNRGTSGIDGSTSTAIGASIIAQCPTLLITGDLSFFYDNNALWNENIPKNFRIIIVNNSGGGIFRILPGEKDHKNFATYFETQHNLTAEQLAVMFNFDYMRAADEESLKSAMEEFFNDTGKPGILEVFTPSEVNDAVLLEYFNFIK